MFSESIYAQITSKITCFLSPKTIVNVIVDVCSFDVVSCILSLQKGKVNIATHKNENYRILTKKQFDLISVITSA